MASTQSGITASDSLLATWASWLSTSSRLFEIVIEREQFVASDQREKVGSFEEDFNMLKGKSVGLWGLSWEVLEGVSGS